MRFDIRMEGSGRIIASTNDAEVAALLLARLLDTVPGGVYLTDNS